MRRRISLLLFLFFLIPIVARTAVVANSLSTSIPTVIVTAPKKKFSLTSGQKTIISKEQLSETGVANLAQALQNLGGIQLQDTSGNGSQVMLSMRGFGANANSNTLLLVNGIPLTNPDMAPPDLNIIPLLEIESIEIIAGSESVLYGDQAVGGVINIITRKDKNKKIDLTCIVGSYNQRYCYATLNHQYTHTHFNVSVAKNSTDNYRDHSRYSQDMLLGGLNYTYLTGHINLDYTLANENMQFPGALSAAQVKSNRRQATNDIDFFKDHNGSIYLQHEQKLNSTWALATDLTERIMHGNGVLFSPFTQSRTSYYVKSQLNGAWNNTTLETGVDLQTDYYQLNSVFGTTKDALQKYGVFAISNIFLNPKLNFSLGARGAEQNNQLRSFSTTNNINRVATTTIGTTYQFTPAIAFYLRRAGSFRFPKADENASTPPGVNGLQTQRGVAYEAGADMMRETYSSSLGIYQLNLIDEITFDPTQTPQRPFGVNKNLDPTVRRGMTVSGKYHWNDRVLLDSQYNYVNARFQSGVDSGNRIPLVSENIWRAGMTYHLTSHWNAYSEAIYTGNQFADSDNGNIAGKIGGYTTYNLNLHYTYSHFTASLHINNIFNKYYYFYTVYQPSLRSEFFYPATGRNFALTMNYVFE